MGGLCSGAVVPPPAVGTTTEDTKGNNRAVKFGAGRFDCKKGEKEYKEYTPGIHEVFAINRITTSQYTLTTFLPKSIYGQFRRLANFYFLIMSFMMLFGEYTSLFDSSISWYSTFMSLIAIMVFTMVMQVKDDLTRHASDAAVDARQAMGVDGPKNWKDVKVGDLLIVENMKPFPADVIMLTSSSSAGACYIETSNIDGETNLKIRNSVPDISDWCQGGKLGDLEAAKQRCKELKGTLEYQIPNASVNTFGGVFTDLQGGPGSPSFKDPRPALNGKQQLLRGSVLRNTKWIIGMVVYTGEETKVAKNSQEMPSKLSNLEIVVNKSMKVIMMVMFALVIITDIAGSLWRNDTYGFYDDNGNSFVKYWYLWPNGQRIGDWYTFPAWLSQIFTYAILYNNMVPLSMYITMELINFFHAKFINNDEDMWDEETQTPARARSMNLCTELGQVQYIFSDKTGTLTANIMEFKRTSIGGEIFGSTGSKTVDTSGLEKFLKTPDDPVAQDIVKFMTIMAVCHTVVAEPDKDNEHGIHYEAESPDEGALVDGAAACGFRFVNRTTDSITVRYEGSTPECQKNGGKKTEKTFKVLAINAFNSTRKRSSVLVETEEGKTFILCKGADNKMFDRAAKSYDATKMNAHLTNFSVEGLRTLVMAQREISTEERDAWMKKYKEAYGSTSDRKLKLQQVAELIEKDMEIVGASAIEDKLQDGVPECIEEIRKAGVKIWVLTGDKMETAINIGLSCRLLEASGMKILKVKKNVNLDNEHNMAEIETLLKKIVDNLRKPIEVRTAASTVDETKDAEYVLTKADVKNLAVVIEGPALDYVLDPELIKVMPDASDATKEEAKIKQAAADARCEVMKSYMLEIGRACTVVVACRVSPRQKARLVALVKDGITPTPVTLAIGDGANDVSMIKEAQVGVGISGREGLQAANSADFSIAQFRFLKTLLFVHGRYDYRRLSKVILYSFYKNVVLVMTLFYYNFFNGFSGQSLYEDWLYTSFNIFTMMGPICLGIFDVDVAKETVSDIPQLYMSGRLQLDLNTHKMVETIVLSVINSIVIMIFARLAYPTLDDGVNNGVYTFGTLVFSNLFFAMEYRVLFITHTWNRFVYGGVAFSLFLFFLFFFIHGGATCLQFADPSPFFYYVPLHLMAEPIYWLTVISTVLICALFDLIAEYLRQEFNPNLIDLCVEIEMSDLKDKQKTIKSLVKRRLRALGSIVGYLPQQDTKNNLTQNPVGSQVAQQSLLKDLAEAQDLAGGIELQVQADSAFSNSTAATKTDLAAAEAKPLPRTKSKMLRIQNFDGGHDDEDEHDSAFPEDAHTGPFMMAHMSHVLGTDGDTDGAAVSSADTKTATSLEVSNKGEDEESLVSTEAPTFLGACCCRSQKIKVKTVEPAHIIKSDFLQQRLPKRQVYVTAKGSVVAHVVISVLLLVFGGIIYDASERVVYMDASYVGRNEGEEGNYGGGKAFYFHEECTSQLKNSWGNVTGNPSDVTMEYYNVVDGEKCTITFYVPHEMKGPVVVYYRLTDFHQNVFSYFKSRDSYQLTGYESDPDKCTAQSGSFADGDHVKFLNNARNIDGCEVGEVEGCEYLYPCGLVSNSFFNDTIDVQIRSSVDTCTCATQTDETKLPDDFECDKCSVWPKETPESNPDLGWESDKDFFDAKSDYGTYDNTSVLSDIYPGVISDEYKNGMQDPRYMLWMRPAAFNDFKKVYAKWDEDIPAHSEVTFEVTSRFPSFFYGGRKHLVIASSNWNGPTKSEVMPWLFMGFGIYAFFAAFVIFIKMYTCPRKQGSEEFVNDLSGSGKVQEYIPASGEWQMGALFKSMFTRST